MIRKYRNAKSTDNRPTIGVISRDIRKQTNKVTNIKERLSFKKSNQLSLPQQDDCKTIKDTNNHITKSGSGVIKLFSCSTQLSMKFIVPINVKMPTIMPSIVGI